MSANGYLNLCALDFRGQFVKSGIRKSAKVALSRAARKSAKAQLTQEVAVMTALPASTDLFLMSRDELESYADHLLMQVEEAAEAEADAHLADADSFMMLGDDEEPRVPDALLASLPEWMVSKIEEANGDAFELLSLFEVKRVSRTAVTSFDDEPVYD